MVRSFIFLLFLISTIFSAEVSADSEQTNIKQITKTLDNIKKELARKTKKLKLLEKYQEEVRQYLPIAKTCKEQATALVKEAETKLSALGKPTAGEATDISKSRKKIEKEKNNNSRLQGKCSVIELESNDYIKRINLYKQSLLAKELLARGQNNFTLIKEHWIGHSLWEDINFGDFISKQSGLADMDSIDYVIFFLFVVSAFMLGFYFRITLKKIQAARQENIDSFSSRLSCAFIITTRRYVASVAAIYTATILVWLSTRGVDRLPFIAIVTHGLTIVVTLMAIIHWFLHASLEIGTYTSNNKANATSLARRLKVLVSILFSGYLLFSTILAHSIEEPFLQLTRGIFAVVLVVNLLWIVWLTGKFFRTGYTHIIKFVLSVLLITAFILEWVGYRNLSIYIILGILGSSLSVAAYSLISGVLSDFFTSLDTGEGRLAEKTRALLSMKSEQKMPGLVWIRLVTTISIWFALLIILIRIWQIPESYTQPLIAIFTSGFSVGSFNIEPQAILGAILTLSILLFINGWFKRKLEKSWLPKTAMVRSARESMSTVSGYLGASIAIIVAMGVAGLDLTKLAIIAGALSVGIGFGLQNIVNNFISGLILLFERPIKTGDWIVVDDVEGYVKRISIRSTQIQTFDRADVIVPNSSLISGKVVNWMLKDIKGRIRVPIGVAYGSDVQTVKKVLLEIANEHPEIIKSEILAPVPIALFIGFGDSSLDFELRCHIRDIDKKVQTISDLNFAIDAAFRTQKIEIPFPQRDIHIIGAQDNPVSEG